MDKKRALNDGLIDLPLRALLTAEEEKLRAEAPIRALVTASWAELEPEAGRYSDAAFTALRDRLARITALDAEAVVCLFREDEPAWFTGRGGWEREDNIVSFLRFAGKLARETAHLAAGYMTFCAPNDSAWARRRDPIRFYRRLSHMACAHVRAYRLMRDTCDSRGYTDRPIGIGMRFYPLRGVLPDRKDAAFPPLAPAMYQSIPLRAFDAGKFSPPMVNTLRAQSGHWCDFIAVFPVRDGEAALAAAKSVTDTPLWLAKGIEETEGTESDV